MVNSLKTWDGLPGLHLLKSRKGSLETTIGVTNIQKRSKARGKKKATGTLQGNYGTDAAQRKKGLEETILFGPSRKVKTAVLEYLSPL